MTVTSDKPVDREHKGVVDRVVDIQRSLDGNAFRPLSPLWRRDQHERLESLLQWLQGHFAREQAPGGLYQQLAEIGTGVADEVWRLSDQHRIFLSWGAELVEESGREDADLVSLREGLLAFFKLLARHEAREHELMALAGLR